MDATNGAISVIAAGKQLNVVDTQAAANITTAGSSKTIAATILLEDSNTSTGSTSKIVIGSGTVNDLGVTIKSNAASGGKGNVNIVMGAPPSKAVTGTLPSGMSKSQINGTVFFGASATNTITTPTNSTNILLTGTNANLVFNTGKLPASAITVNAGGTVATETKITADPPALVTPLHVSVLISSLSDAVNAPNSNSGTQAGYTSVSLPTSPLSISGPNATTAVNASTAVLSGGLLYRDNIYSSGFLPATQETTDTSSSGQSGKSLISSWISETEIYSGEVPAIVCSEEDLGVRSDVSMVVELKDHTGYTSNIAPETRSQKLMSLNRGAVVFAPTRDTQIETRFGRIHLAARSLALVIAFRNGLAVYDLDDIHGSSVTIESAGSQIRLYPGLQAIITDATTASLGEVNPTQAIGYRSIRTQQIGPKLKAFIAEFDTCQSLQAVLPLRQLVTSKHPEARKVANHLLKSTAILMQTGASRGAYEQALRGQAVAWKP